MTSSFNITTPTQTFFALSDDDTILQSILNPFQVFNVVNYGADNNGTNDASTGINAAFLDAATALAAGRRPLVVFPDGIYRVGTGITAGNPAIDMTLSGIRITGPGTIKLAPGSAADCTFLVRGDRNFVDGITVDGNASGSPSGRGDGLYVYGSHNVIDRVVCQNSKTSSGIDFLINGGNDNTVVNCISYQAGYNSFDDRGDYNTYQNIKALEFGRHGFNKAGGFCNRVTIDGFYSETTNANAVTGLIIDVGQVDGYFVEHAVLRNIIIGPMPNIGGSGVFMKLARIHNIDMEGVYVKHDAAQSSIKIVEACYSIKIKDSFFSRIIDFDEVGGVTGAITAAEDSGDGTVKFTCNGHGLLTGEIIYIDALGYTGVHEVMAHDTNTFTTDCRFGVNITGTFYQCQGSVTMENVIVGDRVHDALPIGGLRTPRLKLRNVKCRVDSAVIGLAFKQTYPWSAIERIDVEDCDFQFGRDTGTLYVVDTENQTNYFASSRKIRWVNNSYRNLGSGTLDLARSTDQKLLFTSKDGGQDYYLSGNTLPAGSVVTWAIGDRFWKATPSAASSPGWICTTAGTLSGGTFSAMPALS